MTWIDDLQRLGYPVEEAVDRVRRRLRERAGGYGPLQVVPFPGDGSALEIRLSGRVLEEGGAVRPEDHHGPFDNLLAMVRRFESDEVPDVDVVVRAAGQEVRARTDGEGYFRVSLDPEGSPSGVRDGWLPARIEVPGDPARGIGRTVARGRVRVPGEEAAYGIISDVDDTVMRTGVTSLVTLARLTLLENARTRTAFPGVPELYRALERGPEGRSHNPFFYVSSSPWNLFDLLEDFLVHRGIPQGPFFLRDLGLGESGLVASGGHEGHKLAAVEGIMRRHPDLRFVLVGDSGQRDPEIYREVVRRHPDRVLAIYIRDVTLDDRDRQVRQICAELGEGSVEMLLTPDSAGAAGHAARLGLIPTGPW